ncbi:MAG: glycosyltransferase [Pyrinomonadaceae bacterium]
MKLHWFSPLAPADTEIAQYTARLLPALTSRAEVTLWTTQKDWDTKLQKHAEVRRYEMNHPPLAELNRGGVSVYHIGNNPVHHGSIWQLSRQHGGLVVLHDTRLHHFFDGLYREQWQDLNGYLAPMEFYYGEAGRVAAAESFSTEAHNIDSMAERYPLTQLALAHALGVIVHTREAYDELNELHRWPLAYAPLPFASYANASSFASQDASLFSKTLRATNDSAVYRLIVCGYIGRNRRLDALLHALAQLPEGNRFHLDIYGKLMDGEDLRALVHSLKLNGQVTIRGFVAEKELDAALARAHLGINLRYPTMGEASASQLRLWAHRLPSLVTQTGWYATLPTDTVAFVRPQHEIADIQMHLRAFLLDPQKFARMGERGLALLEKDHTPERYAEIIIEMAERAANFRAQSLANRLAERAGALMSDWSDALKTDSAHRKVATEIHTLLHAPGKK